MLASCLVDGDAPGAIGVLRVKRREDVVPMLDRFKRAGCLEVKLYQNVPPEHVPAIAAEAHKRGLRVTGHVPTGMDALQAIAAGYDAINHLPHLMTSVFRKRR